MQVLFSVLFLVLAWILNGFALKILWGWFMVPVFSLPALTIPAALGIGIVVSFLTHHSGTTQQRGDRSWSAMHLVTRPILAVVLGAIVNLFM